MLAFKLSVRYSCLTLMKIEFSQQIFPQKNCHEKMPSGSWVILSRQTWCR